MIDAVVVGTSLPALQSALDLAEVGLRVAVLEQPVPDNPFGAPSPGDPSPGDPSRGDPFGAPELDREPDREAGIAALLNRLADGLPGAEGTPRPELRARAAAPRRTLLLDRTGVWRRQPEPQVWGIPAVPLSGESIAALGTAGALRAYRDRFAPLLTVGKTRTLGALVHKRLGSTALTVLVEPQLREHYGVAAEEVEVAIATPGLNEALTRTGSLTAAALSYSERYVQRETLLAPDAGWRVLREALLERLGLYEVEFPNAPLTGASRRHDGGWELELADGSGMQARFAIIDCPPWPGGAVFAEFLMGAAPTSFRIHASIGIEPLEGIEPGDEGLRTLGSWSLRLLGGGSARLSSPRYAAGDPELTALLQRPGPMLRGLLDQAGLQELPESQWSVSVRPAAHATVAERERAAAVGQEITDAQHELLLVGRALHGDDLSAALVFARRRAVAVRRALLGLSDTAEH